MIEQLFPAPLYHLGMACWIIGGLGLLYASVANVRASGKPQLVVAALTMPLYWVLMSLAAVKAMVQLVTHPSYWEKTTHGLDTAVEHDTDDTDDTDTDDTGDTGAVQALRPGEAAAAPPAPLAAAGTVTRLP